MERRLVLSGNDALRMCSFPPFLERESVYLHHAGALCAGPGEIFCADDAERMIWRLDRRLRPTALFAGGPGIIQMILNGQRLLALCAEADSVLSLDARSGELLFVARVGLNPCGMALDETAGVLAVAGGESGEAVLLDASSLEMMRRLPMPGPVCSVALGGGMLHALCLTETLSSCLVCVAGSGVAGSLLLSGMPGVLMRTDGMLLAAVQDTLYRLSDDGLRMNARCTAPGRAGDLLACSGRLLLRDMLSETLWAYMPSGNRWIRLCAGVRGAAFFGE